jgi:hypothetical protein
MFRSLELQSFRLSPRTTKYVEAMIREGEEFDYHKWLQHVREEELKAKQVPVAFSSGESVASEIGDLSNTPDRLDAWASSGSALQAKSATIPRAVYRSEYQARGESPKDRLRRRLMRVSDAFDEFQESRVRDAVYGYLKAVFALVVDHKGRRRTKRLLQRTFQFAGLPVDKNADPFAAVIRCTSEQKLDCKTISKYSRALRYTARCKKPRTSLKAFMKEMGGVGGCADRFAKYLGRGSR